MDIPTDPILPIPSAPTAPITPKGGGKKKSFIAGAVVVGVLVGGYLAWAYFANSEPLMPAEPKVSESPSTDPTAGWPTYSSATFPYQVKHPADYEVRESLDVPGRVYFTVDPGVGAETPTFFIEIAGTTLTPAQWWASEQARGIKGDTQYRVSEEKIGSRTVLVAKNIELGIPAWIFSENGKLVIFAGLAEEGVIPTALATFRFTK